MNVWEERTLPPIQSGNYRSVCREPECGWWREVPALGLDGLIRESDAHRDGHAAACPAPVSDPSGEG